MLKTLLKSVREYKTPSVLSPIFISCEVALECIIPLVMAKLIDSMTSPTMEPILKYSILLIGLAVLSLCAGVLSATNSAKASCGFAKNLRHDLYYRVQDFAFEDIDNFSTSSLITRLTTDVTNVQHAYQMIIRIAIRSPLMLLFSVIMSFSINRKLSVIFLAIIPILGLLLGLIISKAFGVFKRIFRKYDALNNSVQENIAGIRVVKSFVREDFEKEKFNKASEEVKNDFTFAEKLIALNSPVMMLCIYTCMLLISFFGAKTIITTKSTALTTGELSSLITYGTQILMSMMMLSMIFVMCVLSVESAKRIVEVLNYESTLKSPENGIKTVKSGDIDFDNVSFRYHGQSGKDALHNINLHIKSGQTVGIIGGTGSSKTTLIQLISRLYDVTEGSVKVGGTDVRDYDLNSLRNQVSVVLQKNVLFSGTIKENIRFGKQDATDEEIKHVCELAQADEFIKNLKDGYDYKIERGGTNVSGGQKQRLCIARALIKHPRILILDDSTSAVDTKTDAMIRKALKNELADTTKLIIAQRISSVQDSDLIVVMDNGEIVEYGNHEKLMQANGIYREVYDSQNSTKEEN